MSVREELLHDQSVRNCETYFGIDCGYNIA